MRMLLGKYWPLYLAVIITILVSTVLVQIFKSTNFVAAWLFNFVNDWAAALSATAAVLLIITAFMAIRENRRTRSLDKIRSWAEDAITLLYLPSTEEIPLVKWSELEKKLKTILARSVSPLAISESFGGDLEKKVKKASAKLTGLVKTVDHADKFTAAIPSVEELLKDLVEVLDSASKL